MWWQRTVKFWNSLAAALAASLYRRIALASCRSAVARNAHKWAWSFSRGVRTCAYTLEIRVDDLDPIAVATFKSYLCDVHNAAWQRRLVTWQGLSVNPRSCLRDNMPRLCTYNARFFRPAAAHRKILFRPALSNKCMQAFLRFRLAGHNLPRNVGSRTGVPRSHRFCHVCNIGQPGDDSTLSLNVEACGTFVIDMGLFRQHAETMVQFMWQADLQGIAKYVTNCLGGYYDTR